MKTHKDLDVWKNAIELVTLIYKITGTFPKYEIYGLTSQIRRSAVSIPSNIAEGAGRHYKKEFIQFLYVARGSISELETQIIISLNLKYLAIETHDNIMEKTTLIRKQLIGLINYLNEQIKNNKH